MSKDNVALSSAAEIGTYPTITARGTIAQRVRAVANDPHPWIPGAQADFIRDIATTLETQEAMIERLESALRGAGVAAEMVEHIRDGV